MNSYSPTIIIQPQVRAMSYRVYHSYRALIVPRARWQSLSVLQYYKNTCNTFIYTKYRSIGDAAGIMQTDSLLTNYDETEE